MVPQGVASHSSIMSSATHDDVHEQQEVLVSIHCIPQNDAGSDNVNNIDCQVDNTLCMFFLQQEQGASRQQ
jgi:hypothetical protein